MSDKIELTDLETELFSKLQRTVRDSIQETVSEVMQKFNGEGSTGHTVGIIIRGAYAGLMESCVNMVEMSDAPRFIHEFPEMVKSVVDGARPIMIDSDTANELLGVGILADEKSDKLLEMSNEVLERAKNAKSPAEVERILKEGVAEIKSKIGSGMLDDDETEEFFK